MTEFSELVSFLKMRQLEEESKGIFDTFTKNSAYYRNLDSMVAAYKEMMLESPEPQKNSAPQKTYEEQAVEYYNKYGTSGEF
jgi:hypothetical protein